MKKTINILSIAICLSLLLIAPVIAQKQTDPNSLLWEISGNGLAKPSFIYGTVHMICAADFSINDKTKKALNNADQLVLELNLNDPKEMKEMEQLMTSEIPLSKKLSSHQFEQVDSVLMLKTGISLKRLDQFALSAVYSFVITKTLPCPEIKSYEMEFLTLAKEHNKSIDGLETVKDQVYSLGKAYTDKEMVEQIIAFDDYKAVFEDVVAAYKNEDLNRLNLLIKDKKFGASPESNKWMLEIRNANWVKKMPGMMKDKSCFFAVGAAHLGGDDGLIQSLRNVGYQVKPIIK